MSKRSFRTALAVVVATILIAGGIVAFAIHKALSYPDERHGGTGAEIEVEIKRGMSFPTVATLLEEKGVISDATWFRMYAMHQGVTTEVQTRRFILRDDMTPREVLAELTKKGIKEPEARVTLPEGKHMLEYFALIEAAGIAKASDLATTARDPEFLKAHGIDGDSADGYLFPDTYNFVVPTRPAKVLERLITRHQAVWNEVLQGNRKGYQAIKEKLKWSDRDILVMASIVEKEAVRADEQGRIAQVFVNRLTFPRFKPRRLETDPTIRYGCQVPVRKPAGCQGWDVNDRLRRAQLDDKDNPYNTYQHEGLPPGPICNPGRGAISAVLAPDGSDYLFFVARDDRSHVFAKTVGEHERNVDKYIRGKP